MNNVITLNLNETDNENYINKKYTYNNNEYLIIKYNRNNLKKLENTENTEFDILSKFRSVITRNNKVVAYSPPKSVSYKNFLDSNKNNIQNCWYEDFIDGTMINVFYDNINSVWEISTKSSVGGNILFFNDIKNYLHYFGNNSNDIDSSNLEYYKNITFRSMFFEACNQSNFNLETLDRRYSYTFVMQHPYNRIVTPITVPLIYLVKVYDIDNSNSPKISISEINIHEFANRIPQVFCNTNVCLVNKYPIADFESIEKHVIELPYFCVGYMLYDINGNRSKIRNERYEEVRKLRGNQPKLQYTYLSLKKEGKIKEFLVFYPEHILLFNKFKLLVFEYTHNLFMNYVSCFIKKEKPLKEYEAKYKCHMYHLHQQYLNELKINNKIIDKKFVIDYFNSLHPAQQMFVINYNKHKNMEVEENNEEDDEYNVSQHDINININEISNSMNSQEIIVE